MMTVIAAQTLTLGVLAMFSAQPRMAQRALADIAVIEIPRSVKEEMYKGLRDDQAGRLTFSFSTSMALEMLRREGYGTLQPGKPVLKNDVYVEWMSDPEPRYQLLLPLGRVRVPANDSRGSRPRPVRLEQLAGSVGWREFVEGQWEFSNSENAYLPFAGIGAALAGENRDPAFVYFYYSATVRVEETEDDAAVVRTSQSRLVPLVDDRVRRKLVAVDDHAVLDHHPDLPDVLDVLERIRVEHHHVGDLPPLDRS